MFNLYLDGLSLQKIAKNFNSREIKTARGVSGAKAALVGL
ncbi:recombinase family protein [Clostridium sp. N37]|uniref:Recombinase family protein n=1 Tax=Clostridium faecium TaxID=2762223 RepID=A0ABR8YNK3_9CLOT|nr:recombinase family protein [Clostridium faecium]